LSLNQFLDGGNRMVSVTPSAPLPVTIAGSDPAAYQRVQLYSGTTALGTGGDNADGSSTTSSTSRLTVLARNTYFNGATWDRQRGNAAGAFTERMSFWTDSVTPLAASAAFTGGNRDNTGLVGGIGTRYTDFIGEVFTDQAGTLIIEKSADATTWRQAASMPVVANQNAQLKVAMSTRYYRTRFVNGATANTVLFLTSALTS